MLTGRSRPLVPNYTSEGSHDITLSQSLYQASSKSSWWNWSYLDQDDHIHHSDDDTSVLRLLERIKKEANS